MRLIYIWEPETREKRIEFLTWLRSLNLLTDGRTPESELEKRLDRQRYSGRMAIWLNTYYYPSCCGITILAQPGWSFEFYSSQRPMWPLQPTPLLLTNGAAANTDLTMDMVACGSFTNLALMKSCIMQQLSDQIGSQGCYMISDYADGHGQLLPFADQLLDRSKFSLESVARFQNGNTGRMLGTWIARQLPRGYDLRLNFPYLDPKLNKSLAFPSVADAVYDLKEYV